MRIPAFFNNDAHKFAKKLIFIFFSFYVNILSIAFIPRKNQHLFFS
ncbi:hypothetical protein B4100_1027 [Heyndrickxia coagulans]|nr:hypothetical protein B4100_1027 [Heyndrickxia coagulans]